MFFFVLISACRNKLPSELVSSKAIVVDKAAVVSAHPEASKIGLQVLRDGGNAADAAIAVQFALAVCYPVAGNIGGGGFMVYRSGDGSDISTLDFREMAPNKAHADMYLVDGKADSNLSRNGQLAAGVPGSVDGMVEVFNRYSKLKDWSRLVEPSVELARKGFPITAFQAKRFNEYRQAFIDNNTKANVYTITENWKAGDLLVQEDLAQSLALISEHGRDGFYKGPVAEKIVAEMERGNGIMSLEDLANYKSVWREPITTEYQGKRIISMPPPSSGGILLAQLLDMSETLKVDEMDFHSVEAVHAMIEAERRAFADRAEHLGDSDYYPVPFEDLLDKEYLKERISDFNPERASVSEDIASGDFSASEETTHFCVVDADRNAVSITTTINTGFGAKTVVGGAGFFLNNEMDDFSAQPGVPNAYGLLGAEANKIEPGKRMLSSMTPTIVDEDGELVLAVGTPGGSTIITSVYQVVMNILAFELDCKEAVHSRRFHHQWKPDKVFFESDCLSADRRAELESMGHEIVERSSIGKVEAIQVVNGKLSAVADNRGDDSAMGF